MSQSRVVRLQRLFGASTVGDTVHSSCYLLEGHEDVGTSSSGRIYVSWGGVRRAATTRYIDASSRSFAGLWLIHLHLRLYVYITMSSIQIIVF